MTSLKTPSKKVLLATAVTALVVLSIAIAAIAQHPPQKGSGGAPLVNSIPKVLAEARPQPANPYQNLGPGVDVSYPQCKIGLPSAPTSFAILGVSGGRGFVYNPCLANQYDWAKRAKVPVSFYLNLNFPAGSSADRGLTGPAGKCQDSDLSCQAYNYGWNSAADAKSYSDSRWAFAAVWWLDIETYNTWEFDGKLNSRTIQGTIDYFKDQKLNVGIYTAPRMWAAITDGNYDPNVPIWIAGAHNETEAHNFCGVNIGSGPTWLAQYGDSGPYDRNLVCQ